MPVFALTDVDGLAVTMIAALVGSFGIILTILFTLARNAGKTHELELGSPDKDRRAGPSHPSSAASPSEKPNPRADWERDPDWWQG